MDYTARVAEFVARTGFDQIPSGAIEAAKDAILDGVGVALAGSHEPPGRICAELTRDERAVEEAAIFGHGFRSSATMAAFANGASAHALDFDASFFIGGQPMSGLVPAVFALSEAVGATGQQILEAYVVGFEVTAKLAWATNTPSNDGGWHSTATAGSLGCAAAAARLLRLSPGEVAMALGIASSMASGVVWNFGTMTKPLHAALAARNGVQAARLAQKGFTANGRILEGEGGYLQSFRGGSSYEMKPIEELGAAFEMERGVRFKAYPCGGLTHSSIDAVLALRKEHDLTADAIERIDVKVTAAVANRIIFKVPETELQAKFCMPYILARTVLDGRLTPDTFTEDAIHDSAVLALAEKVRMEADPGLQNDGTGKQPSQVHIQLKNGRALVHRVDYRKGTHMDPLSPAELREKFSSCAERVLGPGPRAEAMKMLESLEALADVRALSTLLLGEPARR